MPNELVVAKRLVPNSSINETRVFPRFNPPGVVTRPDMKILAAGAAAPPQKPPVNWKIPPVELTPAADSPIVPSSTKMPPAELPPPPAITLFLISKMPPDWENTDKLADSNQKADQNNVKPVVHLILRLLLRLTYCCTAVFAANESFQSIYL